MDRFTWVREFGPILLPDDVERTNCPKAGWSGHTMCGQHTCCGNPRFIGHAESCQKKT